MRVALIFAMIGALLGLGVGGAIDADIKAGGHIGFADPDVPLGFAFHMNHQGYAWRDPRNIALIDEHRPVMAESGVLIRES